MADDSAPPATAPQTEQGYVRHAGSRAWGFWDDVAAEETPELRWPGSLRVFDRMWRQDAQVSSVGRAVMYPIMRTPWRIDGNGCRDDVTQMVARDLGLPIVGKGNDVIRTRSRDRFSWADHVRLALGCLRYGHSAFEQVYRFDEADGLYHLRKLAERPQRTITRFNVARDGGLISIEQAAGADVRDGPAPRSPDIDGKTVEISVDRLVVYVHDKEAGSWVGQSLLRPGYKNWILKDRLLRVQTQAVERNGLGVPTYTNHEKGSDTDLAKGTALATSVRAGDNSGVGLPYGAKFELAGMTGTIPDATDPVRYHDEQIARAVLAHFLNLGSQTGSWALGSSFKDFFTLALQAIAQEIADVANAHVVEDLVDINFGPTEPAPRLVYDEIGSSADAIVLAITQLVNAGVLRADEDLEQFVRTSLGLPGYAGSAPFAAPRPPQEVPA